MKFLILVLISLSVHAQNFMPLSVVQSKGVAGFSFQQDCESSSKEQCLDVGGNPEIVKLGFFSLADVMGDDLEKPIWELESEVEDCSDEAPCKLALEAKVCSKLGYEKFIDALYTKVYCTQITGYKQKVVGKSFAVDQVAFDAYKAEKAAKNQFEAGINQAQMLQVCGRRVMGLMLVRNKQKNLTTSQVKSVVKTYADISDLLESGSLVSAKEEVHAATADGVLVTEEDKAALLSEIDKCLGL
jgi:hypothetical protein